MDLTNMSAEEYIAYKKEQMKQWRKNNKDKIKGYSKKYYAENKEKLLQKAKEKDYVSLMLARARARAKKKGLNFNLEHEDILLPEYCPILDVRLIVSTNSAKENSPSLDRIVPDLGYVKGNIQVISHLANSMKSSANKDQLLKFAKWILDNN